MYYGSIDDTDESKTTLLSPKVLHLISLIKNHDADYTGLACNADTNSQNFNDYIAWDVIKDVLDISEIRSEDWYKEKINKLSIVINSTAMYMMRPKSEELIADFMRKFDWMSPLYSQNFRYSYELLHSKHPDCALLSLLLSTSTLERFLGDVYATVAVPVPSLLKDLLCSDKLSFIFGPSLMSLLEVLIGPPISLNLRNLIWHGFIAPQEIPLQCCYFLLGVIACLPDHLQVNVVLDHIPRPVTDVRVYQKSFNSFPLLTNVQCGDLENDLKYSSIHCNLLPCWRLLFEAYKEKRFSDCLLLVVPQLETVLRKILCDVNNCPYRILTAQTSELYTTFSEIFHQNFQAETNQLRDALGDQHLVMLLDILEFPNGPRLRDRLSHGEIDLTSITQEITNHVLCLSIATVFIGCEDKSILQKNTIQNIYSCIEEYRPKFALQYILLRESIQLCESLTLWKSSLIIQKCYTHECNSSDDNVMEPREKDELSIKDLPETLDLLVKTETAAKIFIGLLPSFSPDAVYNCLHFRGDLTTIITFLSSLNLPVIYRPSKEIEVVSCFKHAIYSSLMSCEQVVDALKCRYEDYLAHKLRSRQRQTYHRMIEAIPYISVGVRMILLTTVVIVLYLSQERNEVLALNKRFLQLLTHYSENLKIMTNKKKNRWLESKDLTEKFLSSFTNIRIFSENKIS